MISTGKNGTTQQRNNDGLKNTEQVALKIYAYVDVRNNASYDCPKKLYRLYTNDDVRNPFGNTLLVHCRTR